MEELRLGARSSEEDDDEVPVVAADAADAEPPTDDDGAPDRAGSDGTDEPEDVGSGDEEEESGFDTSAARGGRRATEGRRRRIVQNYASVGNHDDWDHDDDGDESESECESEEDDDVKDEDYENEEDEYDDKDDDDAYVCETEEVGADEEAAEKCPESRKRKHSRDTGGTGGDSSPKYRPLALAAPDGRCIRCVGSPRGHRPHAPDCPRSLSCRGRISTPGCRQCEEGPAYTLGHDKSCPRSAGYDGPAVPPVGENACESGSDHGDGEGEEGIESDSGKGDSPDASGTEHRTGDGCKQEDANHDDDADDDDLPISELKLRPRRRPPRQKRAKMSHAERLTNPDGACRQCLEGWEGNYKRGHAYDCLRSRHHPSKEKNRSSLALPDGRCRQCVEGYRFHGGHAKDCLARRANLRGITGTRPLSSGGAPLPTAPDDRCLPCAEGGGLAAADAGGGEEEGSGDVPKEASRGESEVIKSEPTADGTPDSSARPPKSRKHQYALVTDDGRCRQCAHGEEQNYKLGHAAFCRHSRRFRQGVTTPGCDGCWRNRTHAPHCPRSAIYDRLIPKPVGEVEPGVSGTAAAPSGDAEGRKGATGATDAGNESETDDGVARHAARAPQKRYDVVVTADGHCRMCHAAAIGINLHVRHAPFCPKSLGRRRTAPDTPGCPGCLSRAPGVRKQKRAHAPYCPRSKKYSGPSDSRGGADVGRFEASTNGVVEGAEGHEAGGEEEANEFPDGSELHDRDDEELGALGEDRAQLEGAPGEVESDDDGCVMATEGLLSDEQLDDLIQKKIDGVTSRRNAKWLANFEKLRDFRRAAGHSSVPRVYKPDEALGHFVRNCRQQRRAGGGALDAVRIRLLDGIDFEWSLDGVTGRNIRRQTGGGGRREGGGPTAANERQWDDMFGRLTAWHEGCGNTRVPQKHEDGEVTRLGKWINSQRSNYGLKARGIQTGITDDRIARLTELDPSWMRVKKKRQRLAFSESVEQLREFWDRYGHCNVVAVDDEDKFPGLKRFVRTQRFLCRKFESGSADHADMTQERLDTLRSIGFTWETKAKNQKGRGKAQGVESDPESGIAAIPAGRKHDANSDVVWEWRLKETVRYKIEHGECSLKKEPQYPGLLSWAQMMRRQYWHLQKWKSMSDAQKINAKAMGRTPIITEERVLRLEEIGFDWWANDSVVSEEELAKEHKRKVEAEAAIAEVKLDVSGQPLVAQFYSHNDRVPRKKRCFSPGAPNGGPSQHWERMYQELCDYQLRVGDCNVKVKNNTECPALGSWVKSQRRRYTLLKAGQKPYNRSKIDKLESIGFIWQQKVKIDSIWDERYTELLQYISHHGHTNVVKGDERNRQLVSWMAAQRNEYKAYKNGKHSHLTDKRINKLARVGLARGLQDREKHASQLPASRRPRSSGRVHTQSSDWEIDFDEKTPSQDAPNHAAGATAGRPQCEEIDWEEKIEALKKYKDQCGSVLVPARYKGAGLGNWVRNLRSRWNSMKNGKTRRTHLAPEKIQALNELGFVWEFTKEGPSGPRIEDGVECPWMAKYKELKRFREGNGHTHAPATNPSLWRWVSAQKQNRRLMEEGKSLRMTAQRMKLLDEIGFDWGRARGVRRKRSVWEERLKQLTEFQEKFHHLKVPNNYQGDPKLGRWVGKVRADYKAMKAGVVLGRSCLKEDKIKVLEGMCFEFDASLCNSSKNTGPCRDGQHGNASSHANIHTLSI